MTPGRLSESAEPFRCCEHLSTYLQAAMLRSYHRGAFFGNLEFPTDPVAVVGLLKGKSNFQPWHSAIQPILLSNPSSSELILGTWTEPHSPTSCTAEEQATFDQERREWHTANTGTCRFIRATLAENVV